MPASVLIVDDEKHTREGLQLALEEQYEVYLAASADEAFNQLDASSFEIVLTDLRMQGKSGMSVIDRALRQKPPPVVIMMTAYGSVENAVEAMKRGAYDFLTKPVNLEKLDILLRRAQQSRQLESKVEALEERLDKKYRFESILGNSPAVAQMIEQVKLVAPSRATVLLQGETGTGKELVAQAIHQNSPRARGPFLAVHCAALAPTLLESELFGHEKGAFTGANERRIGRFEAADGGSLFLDEIGEIDASTQVKLLRFLESRTFERLGSVKQVDVDVRLICATNRDLAAMVKKGDFREDLFYRLNVVTLKTPPLRERPEDLELLLDHYLRTFARENDTEPPRLEAATLQQLRGYRWPGNIRELRNLAENWVVMKRGGVVTPYDLDPRFQEGGEAPAQTASAGTQSAPPALSVEENEKRLLRQALVQAAGNRTRAAALMGISRRTLHRKLQQWPELDVVDKSRS